MLRVGVVGCGSIVRQRHAPEYKNNKNVELKGFYDAFPERARQMCDDFGGRPYATLEELLGDSEIDAVSVCSSNATHAEIAIAALKAGKHVLCEKPMSITIEDCRAMVEASEKYGKRLLIGHNQRLTEAHKKAKELLESGALGRVITFKTCFGHRGPESWCVDKNANTWFFKKSSAAFGSTADLGIHKTDLICWLIGGKVDEVYADMRTLDKKFEDGSPIEVDDNSTIVLHFKDGPLGTVTTSWTYYGDEDNSTILYCENGILEIYKDPKNPVQVTYRDGRKESFKVQGMQTNEDAQQASSGVIDLFVDSVISGKPSVIDASEAIKSMEVVFAAVRSNAEGKKIKL